MFTRRMTCGRRRVGWRAAGVLDAAGVLGQPGAAGQAGRRTPGASDPSAGTDAVVPGPGMARFVVAAAWVYEGLWAKVLDREPRQGRILVGLPGVGERRARAARLALGTLETAAAAWILAGRAPRATALVQTAVITAMGEAARRWAREEVTDHRALALQRAAFVTLVWLAARDARP